MLPTDLVDLPLDPARPGLPPNESGRLASPALPRGAIAGIELEITPEITLETAPDTTTAELAAAEILEEDDFDPYRDGEPMAETSWHVDAIYGIYRVLLAYFTGGVNWPETNPPVTVFANQFLYYDATRPRDRVAPDCMVVFGVKILNRLNYRIWDTGIPPTVVFEVTSESTRQQDLQHKKDLYAAIGVQEYWLFDPLGDWIGDQLLGYHLVEGRYEPIPVVQGQAHSEVLAMQLHVSGAFLLLIDDRTGKLLLATDPHIDRALQAAQNLAEEERQRAEHERQRADQEHQRAEQEYQRAEQERQRADRLAELLRQQGITLEEGD